MIDWFMERPGRYTIIVMRWRELNLHNKKNPANNILKKKSPRNCRYFLNVVSPTSLLAVLSNTFCYRCHDFVIFAVFFARYNVLYRPDAYFYS